MMLWYAGITTQMTIDLLVKLPPIIAKIETNQASNGEGFGHAEIQSRRRISKTE
jgi:hypothetical protein